MKLIVHITKDGLEEDDAKDLYHDIKELLAEKWPADSESSTGLPYLHVNGQILTKFPGSHETGEIPRGDEQ